MKKYSLSKEEMDYLIPLDSVFAGLNVAIQHFIAGNVYRRIGISDGMKAQYNLKLGEIIVFEVGEYEALQLKQAEELLAKQKEVKPVEPKKVN